MDGMTIIYLIGALGLGFLFGTVFEVFVDSNEIRKLVKQNDRLKMENEALMNGKKEVIEIIDNRTTPEETDYFRPW